MLVWVVFTLFYITYKMVHRRYQYPNQWLPYAGAVGAGIAALHGDQMFGHKYPKDSKNLWRPRKFLTRLGNVDIDYEPFRFVSETHKKSMDSLPTPTKTPMKRARRRSSSGSSSKRVRFTKKSKATKKNYKIQLRKLRKKKRSSRKGPAYIGGISRGFFKPGSRKVSTFENVSKAGISVVRETGPTGSVINGAGTAATAFQCVAIMHTTTATEHLLIDACRALVKYLAKKLLNHDLINFAEIPVINGVTSDGSNFIIEVFYRQSLTSSSSSVKLTLTNGTSTWENLVSELYTNFRTNMTTNFMLDSARAYEMTNVDTLRRDFRRCSLTAAKIKVHIKSALKIQNQSKNVSGDENSLDNIPLYGKSYEGSGNFCYTQTTNIANQYLEPAVSEVTPPTATYAAVQADPWAEPPRLALLRRAKKEGPAHLDPGEIRTSVLSYTKTFWLSGLLRLCNVNQTGGRNQLNIGNFRAFFFEKMINSVAPGTSAQNQIVIAYEHDHKTAMHVTCRQPVPTTSTLILNVS